MNKVFTYISIGFDIVKSFLLAVLVFLAIIIAFISIMHNVFKIREIYAEDTTGYKQLVWVDENRMNVQVAGSGEKTIVILSDFASPSPIIQYKSYLDRLSSSYRVVIIEYFGYGFSLSTKEERTAEKIATEIKEALEQVGIYDNYEILANGSSSLYAYAYSNMYPEVERLILVDGVYPSTIEEGYIKETVQNQKTNSTVNSYAELTGFARILSYTNPEIFGIDKMEEMGFSKSDIVLYRKMIANRYYTSTMKNEAKKLEENMNILRYYKLPSDLPVIQILSKEYVNEFANYKQQKLIEKDIEEYANEIISNSEIQKTVLIEGKKNLNIYNPDAVVQEILKK